MSATSHGGAPPSVLPAAGWRLVRIGDRAFLLWSGRQGVDPQEIEGATDGGEVCAADVQGSCGGSERPVSEEKLESAGVDSRFEQMGGKAMAQGMEACAVREVGGLLGVGGDPLGSPAGHRWGAILPWKYPPWWTVQRPRGPQCGQHAGGKERGAVLTPFALMNTHQPAVTFAVRQLQMDDRTDPQTGGVGRHQEGAVFGVPGTGEEALEFLSAQDVWQR